MSLVTPDVSGVTPDIKPGDYRVRVTEVASGSWDKTDGSSTPYLSFVLETTGSDEANLNGRKIWHKTPISGRGAFTFAKMHKASIGEEYQAGQQIDTEMYLGREVLVTLVDGVNRQTGVPTGYTEVKAVKEVQ